VSLPVADLDEGGDERGVERSGHDADGEGRKEERDEVGVESVAGAERAGDGEFLGDGNEFGDDGERGDDEGRAEDAAIDRRAGPAVPAGDQSQAEGTFRSGGFGFGHFKT